MLDVVRKLLLGVILLEIPIQMDVYWGSPSESQHTGAIEGMNVSVTTACLGVLYLLWLPRVLVRPREAVSVLSRISPAAVLYPAAVVASYAVARNKHLVLCELVLLVQAVLLYVYAVAWIKTRRDATFVVALLLAGLAAQAVIVVGLRGVGETIVVAGVKARIDDNNRVGGTIGSPNGAGGYFAMLLPLSVAVLASDSSRRVKQLGALSFSLGTIAIILTQSRGSWIGLSLAMLLVFGETWRKGRLNIRVPLLATLVGALVLTVFSGEIIERITADDRGAAYSRIPLMKLTAQMIQDHPLLGVGASNFGMVAPQYAERLEFREIWLHAVHNKYLLVFAETGFVGLVMFLWFIVGAVLRGWRVWARHNQFSSPIALGITAGILAHMVHMLVDILNGRPFVQIPWLLAGFVVALSRLPPDDEQLA